MKRLEKEIFRKFESYQIYVDAIARREFERVVKPYCIKKGYDFTAGNGTYLFSRDNAYGSRSSFRNFTDSVSKRVRDVLDQELPGMPANSLGTIMPSFENPNIFHRR